MSRAVWMMYGASGDTGTLIAEEAIHRGHLPLLVGCSAHKMAPLGERLGLEWATVSLDDLVPLFSGEYQDSCKNRS